MIIELIFTLALIQVYVIVRPLPINSVLLFFSPPVLMHGGLLGVAFCQSVHLSVCPSGTGPKFTRKKIMD